MVPAVIILVVVFVLVFALVLTFIVWYTHNPSPSGGGGVTPATLPVIPVPLPGRTVVQFYNNSNQTLLLGAAGPELSPSSMPLPREKTWTMLPGGILTIDIPKEWESTAGKAVVGPRFWARTGCRFDEKDGKAQCETGDCPGVYNCYKGGANGTTPIAGKAPASLAEFCFSCGDGYTYYDVSLVDGYNLSINVEPIGQGKNSSPYWSVTGLCNSGQDLRAVCPPKFQLKSSDIGMYIPRTPDNVIACFSNCGYYEYPTAPPIDCDESKDPKCKGWRQYCCQETTKGETYGKVCPVTPTGPPCKYGAACWDKKDGQPPTCQCMAYAISPPCSSIICTNREIVAQPEIGSCVGTGDLACVGDDTFHSVCARAYSWPNDPQTYFTDAKIFRVSFAFGGSPVAITPASPIPACSSLPASFDYKTNSQLCSLSKGKYGGARRSGNWDCDLSGSRGTEGLMCVW